MGLIPGVTGLHLGNGRALCLEHQIVNGTLLSAKLSVHGESAGDVRGIPLKFTARINQHEIPRAQSRVVLGVVQDAGVRT